jgi:hypothetical protein
MTGHTPWRDIKHKARRGRPPTDHDATHNLKRADKTQTASEGTEIGLLPKRKIMSDFRKVVRGKKRS